MRIRLEIAEDSLLLEDIGSRHLLRHHITVLVAIGLHLHTAIDQETELGTGLPDPYDRFPRCHLHEAETDMSRNNLQVITTHPLEKGELEQLVIYPQGGHQSAILSFRDGENHTAFFPCPSS